MYLDAVDVAVMELIRFNNLVVVLTPVLIDVLIMLEYTII